MYVPSRIPRRVSARSRIVALAIIAFGIAANLAGCKKADDPAPLPIKEAATDSLDLFIGGEMKRYAIRTSYATFSGHKYFSVDLTAYHGRLDSVTPCATRHLGLSVPVSNNKLQTGRYSLPNRDAAFDYVDCDAPYVRYMGAENRHNQTFLSILSVDEAAGKVRINFSAQLYILPGDDPNGYGIGLPDTIYAQLGPTVVNLPK